MIDRRGVLAALPMGMAALASPAWAEVEPGPDGLFKQPWMHDSFLDLGEDLSEAADTGRHLMVLYEQAGCPYCRELHRVNFARPEIADYVEAHFLVVQLDLWGARGVTDFDGEEIEERALAAKWGVNFTPTTILFDKANAGAAEARSAESFRLPGYLKPFHYLSSLEYVVTGEHDRQPFQRYLQDKFAELEAKGIDPDVW